MSFLRFTVSITSVAFLASYMLGFVHGDGPDAQTNVTASVERFTIQGSPQNFTEAGPIERTLLVQEDIQYNFNDRNDLLKSRKNKIIPFPRMANEMKNSTDADIPESVNITNVNVTHAAEGITEDENEDDETAETEDAHHLRGTDQRNLNKKCSKSMKCAALAAMKNEAPVGKAMHAAPMAAIAPVAPVAIMASPLVTPVYSAPPARIPPQKGIPTAMYTSRMY